MENMELYGVKELSLTQTIETEGGLLTGMGIIWNVLKEVAGEITDLYQGAVDGFNAVTGEN